MNTMTQTRPAAIDVATEARRMKFRHPVSISQKVWDDCVHWDEEIEAGKSGATTEEIEGRLRDLLWAALSGIRSVRRGRVVHFDLWRIPPMGRGTQMRPVTLSASIGPGPDGAPVITISTPIIPR